MRTIQKFIVAALLAAITAVPAQAQGYSEERLFEGFNDAVLTATLAEIGATWETAESDDGATFYQVTFESGLKAFAYFAACDSGDCMGLTLVAVYDRPSGLTATEVDEIVRIYNDTYSAGKAIRGDDGSLLVQAYVISDHGITMGNLLVQIQVFEDLAVKFAEGFDE